MTFWPQPLLNHPWLIGHHAEDVANLPLTSGPLARLRDAILSLASDENSLDRASMRSQLERLSLRKVVELVERAIANRRDRFAQPDAEVAEVETGWRHTLALHERQIGLRRALEAAERAWNAEGSEDALHRICEIQRLLANLNCLEFPAEA